MRLDDRVSSWWFATKQSLRQVYIFEPLLLNILFAAIINVVYTRFKVDEDIREALAHTRKIGGGGAAGSNHLRASSRDVALGHD